MDCFGQICVIRNLAKSPLCKISPQKSQLRVRALYDVLIAASNEDELTHNIFVRLEAAYALALWQNEHAPFSPNTESVSSHTWAGMNSLITALKKYFIDSIVPSPQFAWPISIILPKSNELDNYENTQLRCGLLIALSTIRAKNGETPLEIINILLNFADNNNNDNSSSMMNSSSNESKQENKKLSFDDRHYCSVLCYCLSNIRISKNTPHSNFILSKIVSICNYFIETERMLCNHEGGNSNADGYIPLSEVCEADRKYNNIVTSSFHAFPNGGMLTATALLAICEAEIQMGSSEYRTDTTSDKPSKNSSNFDVLSCNYLSYIICCPREASDHKSLSVSHNRLKECAIVRSSALDCYIRLVFSRFLAKFYLKSNATESPKPITKKHGNPNNEHFGDEANMTSSTSGHGSSGKLSTLLGDCINTVCGVITHDPNPIVKRNAAMSLLSALQFKKSSYIIRNILSLNDPMGCFNWGDTAGFVSMEYLGAKTHIQNASQSSEYFRQAFNRLNGTVLRQSLRNVWNLITKSKVCACDQNIRNTMISVWLYCFRKGKDSGKQKVPRCLQTDSTVIKDPSSSAVSAVIVSAPTTVTDPFFSSILPASRMLIVDPEIASTTLNEFVYYGGYSKDVMLGGSGVVTSTMSSNENEDEYKNYKSYSGNATTTLAGSTVDRISVSNIVDPPVLTVSSGLSGTTLRLSRTSSGVVNQNSSAMSFSMAGQSGIEPNASNKRPRDPNETISATLSGDSKAPKLKFKLVL
jgi:hypothetical protein